LSKCGNYLTECSRISALWSY